jgi:hypothetical protein
MSDDPIQPIRDAESPTSLVEALRFAIRYGMAMGRCSYLQIYDPMGVREISVRKPMEEGG